MTFFESQIKHKATKFDFHLKDFLRELRFHIQDHRNLWPIEDHKHKIIKNVLLC